MHRWFLPVLAAVSVAMPVASAQLASPSGGCTDRDASCDPWLANGGRTKEGDEPVRVLLFAHYQGFPSRAELRLDSPTDPENAWLWPVAATPQPDRPTVQWTRPPFSDEVVFGSDRAEAVFYVSPSRTLQGVGVVPAFSATVDWFIAKGHGFEPLVRWRIGSGSTDDPGSFMVGTSVDGKPVYEVRVKLELSDSAVPAPSRLSPLGPMVVAINVHQAGTRTTAGDLTWRLVSGPQYPSRLSFDVLAPLVVQDLEKHVNGQWLTVEWTVKSVIGQSDVRRDGMAAVLRDALGRVIVDHGHVRAAWEPWCHGDLTAPVPMRWFLNLTQTPLADGHYTLEIGSLSHHGTFLAEGVATFEVAQGRPLVEDRGPPLLQGSAVGVPSLGALAGLGAITMGLIAARCRSLRS